MSTTPAISTEQTEAFLARSRAKTRRFRLLLRVILIALFGVWITSGLVIQRWAPGDWRRTLVALSPIVPLAVLILFFRRSAPHLDEFGRRIVIEGAAWGMAVSLPLLFVCSLVRNAGLNTEWLTIALVITWAACGVGLIRAGRRLR
jgi:hypothetical protein